MPRRRQHRNDDYDIMSRAWKPIAWALGVLLTLAAAAAALAPAYRVPFAQKQMHEQLIEWKVATHEPRISALEKSGERLERQLSDLSRDVQKIHLDVAADLREIKTLVGSITSGVSDAQRKANAAEQTVEDYQVGVDDTIRRIEEEQRRLHNMTPAQQTQRGKP
jgi:peptidoglycan hydrolase CwlO-like protein